MPDTDPYATNYEGQGSRTSNWAEYQKYMQQGGVNGGSTGSDVANGLFHGLIGGPAGVGEDVYGAASGDGPRGGNDLVGLHIGDGTTIAQGMTEDVYNSMSQQEWDNFAHSSGKAQAAFIQNRKMALNSPGRRAAIDAANKQKADAAARDKWTSDQQAKVQKFADEMGMGVDELLAKGDTGIGKVADTAVNTSQRGAYSRGLGSGGVSTLNTQRAMGDAMQNYVFQRQQAGNSARMGLLNQIENTRQYNQGIDLQLQQAQAGAQQQSYQQAMQQAGGTLGLVGAGVGAYFGGPAGAQAGYQMGSGLGQQQYQSNNPYHPYTYKNNYGTGGGLGGQ